MRIAYAYDAYDGQYCMPLWRRVTLDAPDGSTPAQIARRCERDARRRGHEAASVWRVVERDGRDVLEAIA